AAQPPDTIGASFVATGRGWRHPTFTCRRPAPGRRARWLEIQGPVPTGNGDAPAMAAESVAAFSGSRPQRRLLVRGQADGQSTARVIRRRGVGAERQPVAEGESPPSVAE